MSYSDPPRPAYADVVGDAKDTTTALLPRLRPTPRAHRAFVLQVETGPSRGTQVHVREDAAGRLLAGKGETCELRLVEPDVSRRHVALEIVDGWLRVEDLSSKNGTYVDGVRVESALLRGGETLAIASVELSVRAERAENVALTTDDRFGRLVGASHEMRRIYPLCEKLARARLPALIEGETGTGKEVLAEALHEQGPRAGGPFIVFDCTSVAPTLLESELFGHERGAFTGAVSAKPGVFEMAHGGTLLIDEIGDMPIDLQPKLLRLLERGEVRRVGGRDTLRFDVRILSATRRDLDREITEGRFRDDLYHRLAVGRVELPPLRRRGGDVRVLAAALCRSSGGSPGDIPSTIMASWEDYAWPGNVRELRNAVTRYLELGDGALPRARGVVDATAATEGDFIARIVAMKLPIEKTRKLVVDEVEQRAVEQALADHEGHVGRAADALGVARRHFQRLRHR